MAEKFGVLGTGARDTCRALQRNLPGPLFYTRRAMDRFWKSKCFYLASRDTSPIIASGILNPALAYLLCSRVLHVNVGFCLRNLSRRRISAPRTPPTTFFSNQVSVQQHSLLAWKGSKFVTNLSWLIGDHFDVKRRLMKHQRFCPVGLPWANWFGNIL